MKFSHPAFAPYQALIGALKLTHALPTLDALNALSAASDVRQARGLPVRFFIPDRRLSARDYETHILCTGEVPTRVDTWHDVLNALVWLRFPLFKAALNAAHSAAFAVETGTRRGTRRGRRRDALTVLDESGVGVISRDPILPRWLIDREWHALFSAARSRVEADMCFIVMGHALLEKALAPYPSMTGKCLILGSDTLTPDAADALAAAALETVTTPRELAPLPIQGIPGWDAENVLEAYYANQSIFRPAR